MRDLAREEWERVLDGLEDPAAGAVAEGVADVFDEDVGAAYDLVEDAIDAGPLVEDDVGAFGAVRLAERGSAGGGSSGDDPEGEADEVLEDDLAQRSLQAFAAAVDFFNSQLDRDISDAFDDAPATPREYYTEYRGWDSETIAEKKLGYAPADESALLDHLMRAGFDGDAIQGTGLFYEDFTPHFQGRYILPYFDSDDRPVYTISRSLNHHEGGHPRDPKGDQKYTKAIKTKDRSCVDEPIYGRETVDDDTDRLLVAGGIADAITLHEAGYACISPVTTVRFKSKHEAAVVDLVDEHSLDGVYMLNDAERPSSDLVELEEGEEADAIGDVLTIKQYGEGERAAFGNAEFLLEEGVDAYLARLPGGDDDLRKLDPDDYIKEEWGSVETLLASARHAESHSGYTDWSSRRRARQVEKAVRTGDASGERSSGDTTELYDLEFPEVAGMDLGDRQNNPLGHHGDSEGYFVCAEKRGFKHGYDHKYNIAYNAVSFLLCDAGERRADEPNGSLSDWEVFVAWKHAKAKRHLPEDDPVPYRALLEVAVRDGLVARDELVERDAETGAVVEDPEADTYTALPPGVYNDVLDHVAEEYDVDPGREPAGARDDPDAEPVAPLALEKLDALGDDERERVARKHGVEIPSTREARERLRNAILRELRAENSTVLDAPTALGKSYTVATEPWRRRESTTGGAPVVHLHQTRDARDEAALATGDSSATGDVLLGRKEASPLARGDHDPVEDPDSEAAPDVVVTIDGEPASEWFDRQCDEKGLPFSTALAIARDRNDQGLDELPPFGEEDPAVAQWDGLPRDDDGEPAVDVIHATHQFAHVPSMRSYTNVVLDEQPDFTVDVAQERIRRMVTAYLREVDAPVSTFEAFVTLARGASTGGDAAAERDRLDDLLDDDHDLGAEWFIDHPDAHALAPDLTRAIWTALRWEDADANGRHARKVVHEPPRFDAEQEGFAARTILSVVVDEDNTVRRVRSTPDFSHARSVVGLDAHPSMPLWELNADAGMTSDKVLGEEERRLWRRYERGLTVVQVGDATRPRSGPKATEWMNDERVRAVLEAVREQHGSGFKTALATAQTEARVRSLLEDVAGPEVDRENTIHFGEEKSRNDFADEGAGYVYGCMDPGDDMVLDALAELDLEATPERAETDAGDVVRAKGRGFDGPDADTAAAVLASVRENHVAQAAGRYARNADDPDSEATVYVHTDAAPEGFVDYETPGVEWLATDLQRDVIDALTSRSNATAREIADVVDCSKKHVHETLGRLEEKDLVEREEGAGRYGADVYRDRGAEPKEVNIGETVTDRPIDYSRWSLAIDDRHAREESGGGAAAGVDTDERGVTAGDPPDI